MTRSPRFMEDYETSKIASLNVGIRVSSRLYLRLFFLLYSTLPYSCFCCFSTLSLQLYPPCGTLSWFLCYRRLYLLFALYAKEKLLKRKKARSRKRSSKFNGEDTPFRVLWNSIHLYSFFVAKSHESPFLMLYLILLLFLLLLQKFQSSKTNLFFFFLLLFPFVLLVTTIFLFIFLDYILVRSRVFTFTCSFVLFFLRAFFFFVVRRSVPEFDHVEILLDRGERKSWWDLWIPCITLLLHVLHPSSSTSSDNRNIGREFQARNNWYRGNCGKAW